MNLTEKYRPTSIDQLVLPDEHHVAAALDYVSNPEPRAWLLHGKSGTGKTSLAQIMARAASGHELAICRLVGPDLDADSVREFGKICCQRPLWGKLHAFVVNEADCIPKVGQIRLLEVLENLGHSAWFFSSNEDLTGFEPRFISRLTPQSFTTQGLFEPAVQWLIGIAEAEKIALTKRAAERLVRAQQSNLRGILQALEAMRTPSTPYSVLKLAPLPNLENPADTPQKGVVKSPVFTSL